MTTKKANKNAYAQDMIRLFTLTNRTHASTLQYFTQKFVDDCQWNINKKTQIIADLTEQQIHAVHQAKEHQEQLDHDAMLKREQDIEWHQSQIELAETLRDYLKEASQQLFPEQHEKSEKAADWIKKYA